MSQPISAGQPWEKKGRVAMIVDIEDVPSMVDGTHRYTYVRLRYLDTGRKVSEHLKQLPKSWRRVEMVPTCILGDLPQYQTNLVERMPVGHFIK